MLPLTSQCESGSPMAAQRAASCARFDASRSQAKAGVVLSSGHPDQRQGKVMPLTAPAWLYCKTGGRISRTGQRERSCAEAARGGRRGRRGRLLRRDGRKARLGLRGGALAEELLLHLREREGGRRGRAGARARHGGRR